MAWQPAPESLRTLIGCIKDSHNGLDKAVRTQAETMLNQAKANPDFNNYLAYIFSSPAPPDGLPITPAEYNMVRGASGIMLKNAIKTDFQKTPDASIALIKMAVPLGLRDESPQVRNYAGSIATELIRVGGLYAWPELLNDLVALIDNAAASHVSPHTQEAAMAALAKICEDNAKVLDRGQDGQRPLNILMPKLIDATASPLPKVRTNALAAINEFIPRKSQAMLASIDTLLQHLFALASDPSTDVRREVCRAFVYVVETRADKLQPHVAGLVDFFISQQQNDVDEDLACQAVEFWLSVGEHTDFWNSLRPFVPKIIPSLLEGMVYSGEEIALFGSADDDDDEEDREQDIKPQFAKSKAVRKANGASAGDDNGGYAKLGAGGGMDQEGLEDGEIEDDEDDDDIFDNDDDLDADERWTVRKGSAAALDVLSRNFGDAIFPSVLTYLTTNIKHEDWPRRESAVLALGAVADGCMDAVKPHLPELVPYLLSLLNDPEPLVRQITCWTLARYASWAIGPESPAPGAAFFEPIMEGFLTKMLDKNKKVQEAAASAMATFEEKAGNMLERYAAPIIQQYVQCFAKYKTSNMYILYDCVQTLAEGVGPVLALPGIAEQLMAALFQRYNAVSDESHEMFPLLECLSYVAACLGITFAPYAQPIFHRCISIIHQNLELTLTAAGNAHVDVPDKDFLVTTLDLISAIVQALPSDQSGKLIADTQPPFFQLLSFCMEDAAEEVRQSAYAVLGDCARFVFPQLQPDLAQLLPILLRQLTADDFGESEHAPGYSVLNNACWSLGEIALQYGAGLAPYVDELLKRFVQILKNPHVPRGVSENAAIALGRMGMSNQAALAPHLGSFAAEFLTALEGVEPTEEKATAFTGFTMLVVRNPHAMEKVLLRYFKAIAQYEDMHLMSPIKQDMQAAFQSAFHIYRGLIPNFDAFLSQLGPADVAALKVYYRF